jgi:hypothetical protein
MNRSDNDKSKSKRGEGDARSPEASSEVSETKIVADAARQLMELKTSDEVTLPGALGLFMVQLLMDLETIRKLILVLYPEFNRITNEDKFNEGGIDPRELFEMTRLLSRVQFELQRLGLKAQTIASRFRDELLDAGVDVKELDAWRLG